MLTRKAPIPASGDAPAPIAAGDFVQYMRARYRVTAVDGGGIATIFRRRSVAVGHTLRRVRITELKRIG
jgi:hypothetical protein